MNWSKSDFKARVDFALSEKSKREGGERYGAKDLAKLLGLNQTSIYEYFNSKRSGTPSPDSVLQMADWLGVTPGWLFFGGGHSTADEQRLLDAIRSYKDPPPINAAVKIIESLPYPKKPVTLPRRDFTVYPRMVKSDEGALGLPCWENAAAGFGAGDLERSDDLVYVGSLESDPNLHTVRIRGDSMEPLLCSGDIIIVAPMPEDRCVLPPLGKDEPKAMRRSVEGMVKDNAVYVLQYLTDGRHDPAIVKRIQFTGRTDDWHMNIVSENVGLYPVQTLPRDKGVRFLARMVGIVGRE
jgi:transcriptional regulator with XRE-family HTH domain